MTRRFSVKVGGKERVVDLDGDGEELRVVVDGRPLGAEVRALGAGVWAFREGESQTLAWVDGEGAKLTVEVRPPGRDPVLVHTEIADTRAAQAAAMKQRAGASSSAPVTLRSPIPGRVVKVLVRAGERVTAGQATVVLEAMKMENELRAPRAGTVHEVRCAEGAAVEAGQDLIVVA
jgi:biotin carboxyl carrier protein